MSFARVYSAHLVGLTVNIVSIEVDISNGLHSFSIVGLGDRSVEESKDRVAAAIKNSGFISPKQKNQKVVVSLAPADIRKEGPAFDMAITLAYLRAAGEVAFDPEHKLFLGEVSLEGNVRKVSGILPILCQVARHGFTEIFIPAENEGEAALAEGLTIYGISSLTEIVGHLSQKKPLVSLSASGKLQPELFDRPKVRVTEPRHDLSQVRGNEHAKRALEIAAAGGHNLLMCGPPGTGKTMLAQCFVSILPPLSHEHAVEVTGIHSIARTLTDRLITEPPFRAPHHTASYPAIIGGGSFPRPGEITLAHRGVLFLDELPEFDRGVIEALRQPLEEREITVARARGTVTFPAQCILLASMNPCPCGLGKERGCTCTERERIKYNRQVSGPIIDRMDLWISVSKVDHRGLAQLGAKSESSAMVRTRVVTAREQQRARFAGHARSIGTNAEMNAHDLKTYISWEVDARTTLTAAAQKLDLSARSFHRIIKIAQTIADLAGERVIKKAHILEALQYRHKQSS